MSICHDWGEGSGLLLEPACSTEKEGKFILTINPLYYLNRYLPARAYWLIWDSSDHHHHPRYHHLFRPTGRPGLIGDAEQAAQVILISSRSSKINAVSCTPKILTNMETWSGCSSGLSSLCAGKETVTGETEGWSKVNLFLDFFNLGF